MYKHKKPPKTISGKQTYWSNLVRERDNYTCMACGLTGIESKIHAHHVIPYQQGALESDFDVSNGVSLCNPCHGLLHGKSTSLETKQKKSKSHMGKRHSEETKAKVGSKHLGQKRSLETRERISLSQKGKSASPETREKMSITHKARHLSDPTLMVKVRSYKSTSTDN